MTPFPLAAAESGILITTDKAVEAKLHLAGYRAVDLVVRGDFDTLIEAITSTVQPASWDEVGGPASIRAGVRGTLDVRHTFQGHQQVGALLEDLRAATSRMRYGRTGAGGGEFLPQNGVRSLSN